MSLKRIAILGAFFSVMAFGALVAFAQEEEEGPVAHGGLGDNEAERGKYVALAMGLGLGMAAGMGGLAQGRATSAALEGLSRNPGSYDKVFTPFILGMVLIESLVIYSLVVSLILLGKIG